MSLKRKNLYLTIFFIFFLIIVYVFILLYINNILPYLNLKIIYILLKNNINIFKLKISENNLEKNSPNSLYPADFQEFIIELMESS